MPRSFPRRESPIYPDPSPAGERTTPRIPILPPPGEGLRKGVLQGLSNAPFQAPAIIPHPHPSSTTDNSFASSAMNPAKLTSPIPTRPIIPTHGGLYIPPRPFVGEGWGEGERPASARAFEGPNPQTSSLSASSAVKPTVIPAHAGIHKTSALPTPSAVNPPTFSPIANTKSRF